MPIAASSRPSHVPSRRREIYPPRVPDVSMMPVSGPLARLKEPAPDADWERVAGARGIHHCQEGEEQLLVRLGVDLHTGRRG